MGRFHHMRNYPIDDQGLHLYENKRVSPMCATNQEFLHVTCKWTTCIIENSITILNSLQYYTKTKIPGVESKSHLFAAFVILENRFRIVNYRMNLLIYRFFCCIEFCLLNRTFKMLANAF